MQTGGAVRIRAEHNELAVFGTVIGHEEIKVPDVDRSGFAVDIEHGIGQ